VRAGENRVRKGGPEHDSPEGEDGIESQNKPGEKRASRDVDPRDCDYTDEEDRGRAFI